MRAIVLCCLAGSTLAGCASGPFGSFGGRDASAPPAAAAPAAPVADSVLSVAVDPAPGGAIVTAVALPATQGFWDARLARIPSDDPSVLLLEFRLTPPPAPARRGTPPSREVIAGRAVTNADLAGVRTVAVRGRSNLVSTRR